MGLAREDGIDGGHCEEREEDRDEGAVEDDYADRAALLGTCAGSEEKRQCAERRAQTRHEHRTQASDGSLDDGFDEFHAAIA